MSVKRLGLTVTSYGSDCCLLLCYVDVLATPRVIWLQELSVCSVFRHQSVVRKECLF